MNYQEQVLVVDDEAGIRTLIQIFLQKAEYAVTTAANGSKALDILKKQTFDLVISDLMMPDTSGLDILQAVKKQSPDTEFILITAFGSIETAVEALRQGAHDYIAKPIHKTELLHSVKRALNYRRTKQEKETLLKTLQEHNTSLTQMLKASNRLAHLSPRPNSILNEIATVARQHLNLTIAVSTFNKETEQLQTTFPDNLTDTWWTKILAKKPVTKSNLHNILTNAPKISQSYIIDPGLNNLPYPFNSNQKKISDQQNKPLPTLLVIPLKSREGEITSVLWITENDLPSSLENIQRLEIFTNQITATLENSKMFNKQLKQLAVRNTLVNASQHITTALDHKEVAQTVLDAVLKLIPSVETAVIYYRANLEADLNTVGLTSEGKPVDLAPINQSLVAKSLVDRDTIYEPGWVPQPGSSAKSLILKPLALSTVPLGVLVIINSHPNALNEDSHIILSMLANQAAVALQNASLYAEAQRVDEIEALYEAGKAIDSTLNLQETLTTTMAVSRSLTGASISNVYLYGGDGQRIDSVVTLSEEISVTDADRRMAAKIARDVLESRNPSLVIESQSSDETNLKSTPHTIHSWLAVSLPGSDLPLGVLELGSERREAFTSNDVRLMQIIASHAATAIEKARLYEEVQHRLQQTEALNTISQGISTTLQLDRVLDLVVQSAAKTIPVATHSSLYLTNQVSNTPEIEPEAQITTQGPPLPPELLSVHKKAVQQATQQFATIRITHPTKAYGVWSFMVAPLRVAEAIIGAISVTSPRPDAFHSSDETLLNTFASHASIAIQNANLFRDLSSAYQDLSQQQEEILRSHSTLQALFNGITDGLYITDQHLKIIAINQAEAKRLGTAPQALINKYCDETLWGTTTTAVTTLVQNTISTGKEGIWESQIDAGNRGLFTDRVVHTYPIFAPSGKVNQVIIFAQDVSEQRRLQASLFRSANMAVVGQLASSVAHQINNPLTVIIANSQIMGMDADPDSPDYSIIKHIEEAGTHIRKIVQNLLDFSTQDSYEWFETNVEETIEDALTLVTHSLRKSDISVVKQVDQLPTIVASDSHLKLLWMNLLLNARDAIAAGNNNGVIEITTKKIDPNTVQIQIIDNGIGIPLQHHDRLFHPFFTTKTSGKNLGLGLFTCGAIVEFHRGEIRLENNSNAPGAVVSVFLPIDFGLLPA